MKLCLFVLASVVLSVTAFELDPDLEDLLLAVEQRESITPSPTPGKKGKTLAFQNVE